MLVGSTVMGSHGLDGRESFELGVAASARVGLFPTFVAGSIGALGGALATPGLVVVYRGLAPGGRQLALIASMGLGLWLVMYAAHHGIRPPVAHVIRLEPEAFETLHFARTVAYMNLQRSIGGIGLFAGSMFFFFTVLFRSTLFPRWMVLFTPILWMGGVRASSLLDSPLAGPLVMGWVDAINLMFFIAVTITCRPDSRVD